VRQIELGQVVVFYAVALSLAIAVAWLGRDMGEAALALTMFTAAAAVLVILALFVPAGTRRALVGSLGISRIGQRGYALAVGAPALIFGASLLLLLALGATELRADASGSLPRIVVSSLVGLVISTLLALFEEIGWRGYLLPNLLPLGTLTAMLAVGFLHGVWHLPLILLTDLYHPNGNRLLVVPLFLATLTLAGVFYGYLRLTSASIWPVAIAHAAVNTFWTLAERLSEATSPLVEEYVGGESGLVMIGGLLVLTVLLAARLGGRTP